MDLAKPLHELIDIQQNTPDLYLAIDYFELTEFFGELNDLKRKEKQKKNKEEEVEKEEDRKTKEEEEEEQKKEEEEQKMMNQEIQEMALLDALLKDLTNANTFKDVFGKEVEEIVADHELQLPHPTEFSEERLLELNFFLTYFNKLQEKHFVMYESGNHEQVSSIIEIAISFFNKARIQNEYIIKPTLKFVVPPGKEIERKADCAVFKIYLAQVIVICSTELKLSEEDFFLV